MTKNLDPKNLGGGEPGSVARLDMIGMIGTLNFVQVVPVDAPWSTSWIYLDRKLRHSIHQPSKLTSNETGRKSHDPKNLPMW